MAGEQNLIPISERTPEERKRIAAMGGRASGVAYRKRKLLRECLAELLTQDFPDDDGEMKMLSELLVAKLAQKALAGDVKAFEVLRDTAGEKPVEKIMVAEVEQSVIDDVERMVNDEQRGTP